MVNNKYVINKVKKLNGYCFKGKVEFESHTYLKMNMSNTLIKSILNSIYPKTSMQLIIGIYQKIIPTVEKVLKFF